MKCPRCGGELVCEGHNWDYSPRIRDNLIFRRNIQKKTKGNVFYIDEVYCRVCIWHLHPHEIREYYQDQEFNFPRNFIPYGKKEAIQSRLQQRHNASWGEHNRKYPRPSVETDRRRTKNPKNIIQLALEDEPEPSPGKYTEWIKEQCVKELFNKRNGK